MLEQGGGGGGELAEYYGISSKLCLTVTVIIMFLIQIVVLFHCYIPTVRLAANNRASFPSFAP